MGIILLLLGTFIILLGFSLLRFSANLEKLKRNVDAVLDKYEDDEIVSDEDTEKYKSYINKSLNRVILGSRFVAFGIILAVMGGLILIFCR